MLRQKSIGMSPGRVGVMDASRGGGGREGDSLREEQRDFEMFFSTSVYDHSSIQLGRELRLCCWTNLGLNSGCCPS